jgi:hypothetical protein
LTPDKAVRFNKAVWTSLLIGGSTATFRILRTYAGAGESSYARRREQDYADR